MTLHTVCLCVAAILGSARGFAGGFQLNELGARAMAQGGAFAARASDPSAIYFNPAGLAFQSQPELYLGTTFIMPQVSFYGPVADANDPAIKNETKMTNQTFTPLSLYGTYPVATNFTVGFGVTNPYGLGTEWPTTWVGKYLTTKADVASFYYTPTVAFKVNDQLSIGAGLNVVTGSVKLQQEDNVINTDTQVSIDMTAKTAYGFNVGILYKFSPELSAGVSYRSSVKLNASGTADFNPQITVVNVVNDNVTSSLTLPATAFAGLAYKASPNFTVEADYQYIGWSSYKQLEIDFQKDPTKDVIAPKDYSNTYIIRIGGEYTMDALKLRAGYLYDHSPVASAYVDPILPDANRNGVNIGVGYQFSKAFSADLAYMFLKFDQRQATNTVSNFDGTYNALANLIGVSLGYAF
jgi:long-chain fatty acid transport protein